MPQPVKFPPPGQPNGVFSSSMIVPENYDVTMLGEAFALISSWSTVERAQLFLFIVVLGGRHSVGAEAFMALESRSSKMAAITAVAKKALNCDQMEIFQLLTKGAAPIASFRDKLAHWELVASPHFDDYLVFRDPRKSEHTSSTPFDGLFKFSRSEISRMRGLANQCCLGFLGLGAALNTPNGWTPAQSKKLWKIAKGLTNQLPPEEQSVFPPQGPIGASLQPPK